MQINFQKKNLFTVKLNQIAYNVKKIYKLPPAKLKKVFLCYVFIYIYSILIFISI